MGWRALMGEGTTPIHKIHKIHKSDKNVRNCNANGVFVDIVDIVDASPPLPPAEPSPEKEVFWPSRILSMTYREFKTAGLVVTVDSKLIGERVVFASDNADAPKTSLVVYRATELLHLAGLDGETVKKLHAAKKLFNGEITESPPKKIFQAKSGDMDKSGYTY